MGNTEESREKNTDKTEGLGDCEIKKQRKNFNILKSNEERREEGQPRGGDVGGKTTEILAQF